MTTKAVLFDLDDTLVAEAASDEAALLAVGKRAREEYGIDPKALCASVLRCAEEQWRASATFSYCEKIGIGLCEGLWAHFRGEDPNIKALGEWAPTYRRETWARALSEHGVRDLMLAEDLAASFHKERRSRHICFPGAVEALQYLSRTRKLGLVTNGASSLQREKLRGSGLEPHFDVVVISGEVGVGKPHPLMFKVALDLLSAKPEESVMIGNSLSSDIAPAQRLGIRAIWFNPSGGDPTEGITPDAQTTYLGDLRKMVK